MLLVRHGATVANLARPVRLQGCGIDLSLSPEGVRQAEATAEFLATIPCSAVFSSRMKRAVETAERIAARQNLVVEPLSGLHEVDVGRWEGRDRDEIEAMDPEAFLLFLEDPATNGYPEGENVVQVADRVTPILEALAERHLGQRIIVVVHNVVLRAYLAQVLEIPLARYRQLTQENCCVNVLVWQHATMQVRTVNSVWHLGE
ncbi:Phosphoserine phosphatase 1 [Anatilimnocola aggregata]|uniref:Phosphoserine phosphatase 1 n=1 Tax=Anatilimnocola aggregata TaxID=2528021 RepID=A0A517YB54_9BACT|nr:Phosphoserine phosphatase 1 [Anatilimnocola aggregata]